MINQEKKETMKKIVTADFINYTDKAYPAMIRRLDFRKLFMFICFGVNIYQKDQNKPLQLPYMLLAHLSDNVEKAKSFHWDAGKWLQEFKEKVLPDLTWKEHHPDGWSYKCRELNNHGLSNDTLQMVANELNDVDSPKFYFDNGRKYDPRNKMKAKRTLMEQYLEDKKFFDLNPTQAKIYNYMMDISELSITEKLHQNYDLILKAIDGIDETESMSIEDKRLQQLKILHSIEEDARVLYAPTPLKRSPRLHLANECVLSLKSEVRKAFCTGWTEADLVSSQFVILSALLEAKECQSFLDTNQNLWTFLNNGNKPNAIEKKPLKEAIYSICFGKRKINLKKKLSFYNRLDLLDNVLIKELLVKREEWFHNIKHNGFVTDIWGNKHCLEAAGRKQDIYGNLIPAKERWEGALAATKIQSIEMEIISCIFDAKPNRYYQIKLFQHDGFTISFHEKDMKNRIQTLMQEAITNKAKAVGKVLNIDLSHVKLEFNDLIGGAL